MNTEPEVSDLDNLLVSGIRALELMPTAYFLDFLRKTLENGANPNYRLDTGETVLHLASRGTFPEAKPVALLLDYGAEIDARDKLARTPACVACWGNCYDSLHFLLKRGAAIDVKDCKGNNLLHAVILAGNDRAMDLLVGAGANVEDRNRDGYTPLHSACLLRRVRMVRLLLDLGANPTTPDNFQRTPLHHACLSSQVEVAALLLNAGADPSVLDESGKHPFDLVSELDVFLEQLKALLDPAAFLDLWTRDDWYRHGSWP